MDAIELLRRDHRDVEDLFDRLDDTDDGDLRQELVEQIAHALTVHTMIEEQHFYPAVREKNTERLVREFEGDHAQVKQLLAKLLNTDPDDDAFDQLIARVRTEVENHVKEEETGLFPLVLSTFSDAMLRELGAEMRTTQQINSEIEPRDVLDPDGAAASP